MRPAPGTALAQWEAEQAVKGGAGQDQAGCFHPGQPGSDALTEHGPPGEQVASHAGAGRPHTPPDLRGRSRHASFSREERQPLEKHAREVCGTTHLYRLEDGRLLARRVDCKTKACPKCGPRLRQEYAAGYAEVLAAAGPVYRLVVGPGWRKRPGTEYLRIPAPNGALVVYSTAAQGAPVRQMTQSLADDFAAMPSDRRNVSASTAWRRAYHAWRARQLLPTKAPAEYLGQLRRTLEQIAIIARELGMFIGEAGEGALLLRDPPDAVTWRRFCALAGLYQQAAAA